ncbi:MAG: hypothetical protein ACO3GW_05525 [Vulcanococcus sp.]
MHPTLTDRLERLNGCAGVWILDRRDADQRGYDLDRLPCFGIRTPEAALKECLEQRWKNCRLLFSPDRLNDDCSWPGGYDAPSHYRSNARVFRAEFPVELERADGDADGIALDLRFTTEEMLETIEALESYCILDESDHSDLELECQHQEWESWAASEWRAAVVSALDQYAPEDSETDWAEVKLEAVEDLDSRLLELFYACADAANEYWQEESCGGFYIRIGKVAEALDLADLRELTGLPLLAPDQEWRRESYPWPDGSSSPLAPALA